MEKKVTKTTTEYTYDDKGFILKEVRIVEEWTDIVKPATVDGFTITSSTITSDKIGETTVSGGDIRVDKIPWQTSKAVPPTAKFDTKDSNIVGNLNLPRSTITEITNEVLKGIEKYQGGKPF